MREIRSLAAAAVSALALGLGACSSAPVFHSEPKPNTSPADHPTYAWYDHARPDDGVMSLMGADFAGVITLAGDTELAAKGYRSDAAPALLVNWHLVLHQLVDTRRMAEFCGYGPGWKSWAQPMYPSAAAPVPSERAEEGTLVIDVLLADSKELIWRGFGTGVVDESKTIQERRDTVGSAVRKILSQIPAAR